MNSWMKIAGAALFSAGMLAAPVATTFAASSPAGVQAVTPAVTLRANLDELLSEHALLLAMRMDALYEGNTALSQALDQAMMQNTAALTAAVSNLYGTQTGKAFEQLWNQHRYFFRYVEAIRGENQAQSRLTFYKNQFSQFLAGANPHLSESTLSTVLQDHINQITQAFNDYAGGNNAGATAELVQAENLMFTAGDYLAGGIAAQFPQNFGTTGPDTAAVNLQAGLDQLLGEHAILLELAMQALYAGNTSLYQAYMTQMDANTTLLTQAVSGIYGPSAGQTFQSLWNHHQEFFNYVEAVKSGNSAAAAQAQTLLTQYKNQFSQFLAQANPHLSESTLSTVLQDHINQITQAFQDYVDGNASAAAAELMQDYQLMFTAGGYLANGIVAQFPSKFDNTQIGTPAGNLRITLDQLLGEHAVLLELAMQALYAGNTAAYDGYMAQMDQNTQALTAAVSSIYGSAAGQQFEALWNRHQYFFTYARDALAAEVDQATLTRYKNQFANVLAQLNPHFSAATLSAVLQDHINQEIQAFNDFAEGNVSGAAQETTAAYQLMFTAGDYLATGFAEQFPTTFGNSSPNTPTGNLVASLDALLGLHAVALEGAMLSTYAHNPVGTAVFMNLMDQNTAQLTQAISGIYGAAAGEAFASLWNQHKYFFTYAADIQAGDTQAANEAQASLTAYKNQFSAFLAKANPYLSEGTLSTVLQDHINQITTAFTDAVQGHDAVAVTTMEQAYGTMFTAGQYLAQGIVSQFPAKFAAANSSVTPPDTNTPSVVKGATSPVTGLPILPLMGMGVGLLVTGGWLARRPRVR